MWLNNRLEKNASDEKDCNGNIKRMDKKHKTSSYRYVDEMRRFEAIEARMADVWNGQDGLYELWGEMFKLYNRVEELKRTLDQRIKNAPRPSRRRSGRRKK